MAKANAEKKERPKKELPPCYACLEGCLHHKCPCYHVGKICGQNCECKNCANITPRPAPKLPPSKPSIVSLHCFACDKGCLHHKCPCYEAGEICGQNCKCRKCANITPRPARKLPPSKPSIVSLHCLVCNKGCLHHKCPCYKEGEICGQNCECRKCANITPRPAPKLPPAKILSLHCFSCYKGCLHHKCPCYEAGEICGQNCECENCANITPRPARKLPPPKPSIVSLHCLACNKGCLHHKCPCYEAGEICGQNCECENCANITPPPKDPESPPSKFSPNSPPKKKYKQTIKKIKKK